MRIEDNIHDLDIVNATKIRKGLFQLTLKRNIKLDIGYILYLYNDAEIIPDSYCERMGLKNGFFGIIRDVDEIFDVILIDVEYDNSSKFDIKKIEKVVLYERTPTVIDI